MTPDLGETEPYALEGVRPGCVDSPSGACEFGTETKDATRRFALIGDSHTFHWRAALALVAQVKPWRGYSLSAGGCFFSAVTKAFLEGCDEFYKTVLAWFEVHPEVDTMFVTSNADTPVAVPETETTTSFKTAGFREAYAALPPSVKHIIVLRDTPSSSQATFDCMYRAQAKRTRPGVSCPLARATALREDFAVAAVTELNNPRYESIDMSDWFCGSRDCYPVIGGVRVNADIFGHLTPSYMRTLGPYLLREVNRLEVGW